MGMGKGSTSDIVDNHFAEAPVMASDTPLFLKEKHITYWLRCLRSPLPHQYTSNDSNRMTLAFFTISALDLLGVLHTRTTAAEREEHAAWIYRCQHSEGGFRGFPGTDFGAKSTKENSIWDPANIPATYFALSALCILGDDMSRVKRRECLQWLRRMQRPGGGSFGEVIGPDGKVEGGMDTRFGYCAMVIRWILRGNVKGDVEGVPDVIVDEMVECIKGSQVCETREKRAMATCLRFDRHMMEESQSSRTMKHMASDITAQR
jgi:geranylgeranyl transferase type-1 subunit beta